MPFFKIIQISPDYMYPWSTAQYWWTDLNSSLCKLKGYEPAPLKNSRPLWKVPSIFYFHWQIKAEFERILSERNVVGNLVENYKAFNKKFLMWQPKSSNKNMKCLISDMGIMMSEVPETKSVSVITCLLIIFSSNPCKKSSWVESQVGSTCRIWTCQLGSKSHLGPHIGSHH